jgi:hypothetical protein
MAVSGWLPHYFFRKIPVIYTDQNGGFLNGSYFLMVRQFLPVILQFESGEVIMHH